MATTSLPPTPRECPARGQRASAACWARSPRWALRGGGRRHHRTKVHVGKSPVVVLLVGRQLARPRDLDQALEAAARQRIPADGPDQLSVVVVNASDWKPHLPAEVPAAVRKLIDQICK